MARDLSTRGPDQVLGPDTTAYALTRAAIVVGGWALTAVAAVGGGAVVWRVVGWATTGVAEELAKLQKDYQELAQAVERRKPTIVVALVVGVEVLMVVTDKVFGNDDAFTVSVSLLVLFLCCFGIELILHESRPLRALGWLVWICGVVLVPVSAVAHRKFDVTGLWKDVQEMDTGAPWIVAVATVALLALPFVFHEPRRPVGGPATGAVTPKADSGPPSTPRVA